MNYYLIGMMGSGKTTIGNLLSKKLDHNFFDIDQIIEKNYKTTISNFFEIYGEKKFRETESSMLKKLNGGIISCGGGIILDNDNISFMKDNGICILLKASTNTLKSRLDDNSSRPLLKQDEDGFYLYCGRQDDMIKVNMRKKRICFVNLCMSQQN